MKTLDSIHRALHQISLWAVWIAGCALLLSAIMVTIEVTFREFSIFAMSGSDEISGYVLAASTTWAYSYCLLNRSNVRIDVLYTFLPVSARAILDVVGVALLLFYMSYLMRKAFVVFWTSWTGDSAANTTLQTPLWIPQLAWLLGLVLFVVTLSFVLLYTLTGLIRRDYALVQRIAGAMSAQEEIVQETHGLDVAPMDNLNVASGSELMGNEKDRKGS